MFNLQVGQGGPEQGICFDKTDDSVGQDVTNVSLYGPGTGVAADNKFSSYKNTILIVPFEGFVMMLANSSIFAETRVDSDLLPAYT